jgi:hypothetical protein
MGRDAILDNLQPSLRDLIMFHDVPRTGVLIGLSSAVPAGLKSRDVGHPGIFVRKEFQ